MGADDGRPSLVKAGAVDRQIQGHGQGLEQLDGVDEKNGHEVNLLFGDEDFGPAGEKKGQGGFRRLEATRRVYLVVFWESRTLRRGGATGRRSGSWPGDGRYF
jgi:hypothetical protein